jgi:hypothetical protein
MIMKQLDIASAMLRTASSKISAFCTWNGANFELICINHVDLLRL